MTLTLIMAVTSVLAILNSLFFSIYLIQPSKRSIANFWLSMLLIALALRILKSMVSVILLNPSTLFLAIGLGSMALIGPLLLFYIRSLDHTKYHKDYYQIQNTR